LTEINDRFYVDVVNEKGASAIADLKGHFAAATDADRAARDKAHKTANERISEMVDAASVPKALKTRFEDDIWNVISQKCIGCGACTYLCPTCHCFDITDIEYGKGVKRVRTWDACQYSSFTVHSSGHNPRPNKYNRMRQRIFHKYSYYPETRGEILCTGCGRCITYCPANINLKKIIKELAGGKT